MLEDMMASTAIRIRDLDGEITDILLDDVAKIHEYGGELQFARPHWGPNLRRLQREAPAVRRAIGAQVGAAVTKATKGKLVVHTKGA